MPMELGADAVVSALFFDLCPWGLILYSMTYASLSASQ